MSFADHLKAERRRMLLLTLLDLDGHGNESSLLTALHLDGHIRETEDTLREDLTFLRQAALVTITMFQEKVMVARITDRGIDCAKGRVVVEGVKRPKIIG